MARRIFTFVALTLLASTTLAAAQTGMQTPPPTAPPPAAPASPQAPADPRSDAKAYEVGPGDRISIVIHGETDLAKEFEISADGTINYPYIGDVQVAGMSLRQVQEDIRKRLIGGAFFSDPQVVATVISYRSQTVQVTGNVNSPGDITLGADEMTLSKALSRAQLTALAGSYFEIRRRKPGVAADVMGPEAFDVTRVERTDLESLKSDPRLRDGDQVFVPQAPQYFINGFAKTTGAFVWKPGMTVGKALANAGGLSDRGTDRGMKIKRQIDGKFKELNANENTPVLPDDTIIIKQRRW